MRSRYHAGSYDHEHHHTRHLGPHHPAEDGCRVEVTSVDNDGDHRVFALYKGGGSYVGPRPDGGLGIGRYFRPNELEPCGPPW